MRVVSGLAAMRNKEKLKMTFKRLAVAFGLAGALALAAASPTLAKTKHKKAPPAGAAETVEPGLAYGAHTGVYQAQNSAMQLRVRKECAGCAAAVAARIWLAIGRLAPSKRAEVSST